MKTSLSIAIFLTFSGITSAHTLEEIGAESKKANDFFEKCWDETLSRQPVDESLGDKFDIRQFDEVVLSNGSVPLDVLEELVDHWIKSKQAN